MKPLNLDPRPVFRKHGKKHQKAYADAVRAAGGPPTRSGGQKGGSLAKQILAAKILRVKRWGFVLKVATLGQKLTWFVRGTRRQPARPIKVAEIDAEAVAKDLGDHIARSFNAWQASSDKPGSKRA